MSPSSGQVLIDKIAPRLRSAVPRAVKPFGGEDAEELFQDSIAIAAQMLHSAEGAGKEVTPGNIAYYTMRQMRSGRRSQSASRADAMAPGTQLDGKSALHSLEEPVGSDPDSGEPVTLGEMLASEREDPSTLGARNVDWGEFISSHDPRYAGILEGIAEGRGIRESAEECGATPWSGYGLRRNLARDLREYLGAEALEDSVRVPCWRGNITAFREKSACRHSR